MNRKFTAILKHKASIHKSHGNGSNIDSVNDFIISDETSLRNQKIDERGEI